MQITLTNRKKKYLSLPTTERAGIIDNNWSVRLHSAYIIIHQEFNSGFWVFNLFWSIKVEFSDFSTLFVFLRVFHTSRKDH